MINFVYLVILISIAITLSSCTDSNSSKVFRVHTIVVNKTNEKFTDVSVDGQGYPGRFGNLVAGGRATMSYNTTQISDEFKVSWRSSSGVHQRTLSRPHDFDRSGTRELVVEFEADGDVKAYTEPVPW